GPKPAGRSGSEGSTTLGTGAPRGLSSPAAAPSQTSGILRNGIGGAPGGERAPNTCSVLSRSGRSRKTPGRTGAADATRGGERDRARARSPRAGAGRRDRPRWGRGPPGGCRPRRRPPPRRAASCGTASGGRRGGSGRRTRAASCPGAGAPGRRRAARAPRTRPAVGSATERGPEAGGRERVGGIDHVGYGGPPGVVVPGGGPLPDERHLAERHRGGAGGGAVAEHVQRLVQERALPEDTEPHGHRGRDP